MPVPAHRAPHTSRTAPTLIAFDDSKPRCASCGVRHACLPDGLGADAVRELDRVTSVRMRIRKRSALFRPGDPFRALYAVRLGSFKTIVLAEDGRDQVTGYYIGGDLLGQDGFDESTHTCEAVALEDSDVCVLPYERLDALASRLPALRLSVYRAIARDIGRAQNALFMLGSMRAEERVASFLLDVSCRYHARGYSASEFVLRMTRDETASYLGLTLETVSRVFSRLQGEGLIQVEGRAVKLLDPHALRRMTTHAH